MTVRKPLLVLLSLMLALTMMFAAGCSGAAEEPAESPAESPAEEPEAEEPAIDEGAAITELTYEYLNSELAKVWIMNAVDLNEQLFVTKDAAMQVIDIRDSADFAKGHIEGAINVPYATFADEATLEQLDSTKTFVVVDYDGSKAPAVYLYLTQLGYDTMMLRWGMSGWTTDAAVYTVWDGVGADFPTTTEPSTAAGSFEPLAPSTGAADEREAVINGAKAYFASGGAEVISAADLKAMIDSGADNFQIVSVRAPEHYALGHIEGAINIPFATVPSAESLSKLDPSKTIVVACYQGHTAAQAQFYLKQLGYDVVSLHHGMSSWTNDAAIRANATYNPANVPNLPTVK